MSRLLSAFRSRWVRAGFVFLALSAAVIAVAREREEIASALGLLPWSLIGLTLAVSLGYVLMTMLSWDAVMRDLGATLPVRRAAGIFFVSQLGKYLPGGVWNVVAVSELGADHQIPRRRSVSAMAVTVLISVVSGLAVAAPAIALSPGADGFRLAWLLLPVFAVLLAPPVLNRVLNLALRAARREPLDRPLTVHGTLLAIAWSVAGWLLAGWQLWLLASALGLDRTFETYALASGAYALAWVVGFLVVVAPAGIGARELVLGVILSAHLGRADVVALVLVSRLVLTAADLIATAVGFPLLRRGPLARSGRS